MSSTTEKTQSKEVSDCSGRVMEKSKTIKRKHSDELCPDCGEVSDVSGGCPYCRWCGWSHCH